MKRKNLSLIKNVLDHMQVGIIVCNKKGEVIFANEVAQNYGILETELLSLDCTFKKGVYFFDHTSFEQNETNLLLEVLQGKDVINQEICIKLPGKPLRILLINGKQILHSTDKPIGALFVFHDITERKWLEQRLTVSEQRYRSLFKHNPDMVCWFDINGYILSVNPVTESVIGYTVNELLKKKFSDLIAPVDQEIGLQLFEKTLKGEPQNGEIRFLHKNRDLIHLHLTAIPILVEEKITGIYIVAKNITQKKKAQEMAHYYAYYDTLTNLPNRRLFMDRLHEACNFAKQNNKSFTILFLDLDRFKYINDTFGHTIGDQLLKEVANRLREIVCENNLVSRLGGDEFIILLQNDFHKKEIEQFVHDLLKELNKPFSLEHKKVYISASIGIVQYPIHGDQIESLITHADMAMYAAKAKGKNTYQFYTTQLEQKNKMKFKIEQNLRHALINQELEIYYQPKVNLKTNEIIGAEALLRWEYKKNKFISPVEFIPVAEETGIIIPIGEWILREVCKQIKAWEVAGIQIPRIAINISPIQFNFGNLVAKIKQILRKTNVSAHLLEFEITESVMQEKRETLHILQQIKELGIHISLDDFGTGYSSLSYLKEFPIDTLKIDKSFVQDFDSSIISSIISISKSFGINVIAEGIESKEQLHLLLQLGCEWGQGYLYSRPLPVLELEQFLKNSHPKIFPLKKQCKSHTCS